MLHAEAWGNLKDESGNETARLIVQAHFVDVAAFPLRFPPLPTGQRRMERLAGCELGETDLERLALLAFLYDRGKVCTTVQSKSLDDAPRKRLLSVAGIVGRGIDRGRTPIKDALLHQPQRCRRLGGDILRRVRQLGRPGSVAGCRLYHGRPLNFGSLGKSLISQRHRTWSAVPDYDPWEHLAEIGVVARSLSLTAFAEGTPWLPHPAEFVHAFAGLASLADRIGSDSRPHAFPFKLAEGLQRCPSAFARATYLLRTMSINVETMREGLRRRTMASGKVFQGAAGRPLQPTELQSAAGDTSFGKIVNIESKAAVTKMRQHCSASKRFSRGVVTTRWNSSCPPRRRGPNLGVKNGKTPTVVEQTETGISGTQRLVWLLRWQKPKLESASSRSASTRVVYVKHKIKGQNLFDNAFGYS